MGRMDKAIEIIERLLNEKTESSLNTNFENTHALMYEYGYEDALKMALSALRKENEEDGRDE